jgi:hypothetical protein
VVVQRGDENFDIAAGQFTVPRRKKNLGEASGNWGVLMLLPSGYLT